MKDRNNKNAQSKNFKCFHNNKNVMFCSSAPYNIYIFGDYLGISLTRDSGYPYYFDGTQHVKPSYW